MTWGWSVKGDSLGTPAESAVKATWQDYDSKYLKSRLKSADRRFDTGGLDEVERHVYLQESLKGYEGEAEACLKSEFKEWLQGTHKANIDAVFYKNNDDAHPGAPKRRHVYEGAVGQEMADNPAGHTGWKATRWGTKPLTQLAGVRDFLRAGEIEKDNAERDMNLLAESGPQDLNEAWMYFKHWVKRRPIETCDKEFFKKEAGKHTGGPFTRYNGTGPTNWLSGVSPAVPPVVPPAVSSAVSSAVPMQTDPMQTDQYDSSRQSVAGQVANEAFQNAGEARREKVSKVGREAKNLTTAIRRADEARIRAEMAARVKENNDQKTGIKYVTGSKGAKEQTEQMSKDTKEQSRKQRASTVQDARDQFDDEALPDGFFEHGHDPGASSSGL